MKQKLLCIILTLTMILTLVPCMALSTSAVENTVEISTAEQLKELASKVNSGEDQGGISFRLMNDLDLEGSEYNQWMPIGIYSSKIKTPFNGNFDGGGYTISGLYINFSKIDDQGLFGYVGEDGIVKNLSVNGVVIGDEYIGGVVVRNNGSVENCYNVCEVTGSKYVGGVVGYNDNGTIKNCHNTGKVTGEEYVGGVAGTSNKLVESSYNTSAVVGQEVVGGIVGANSGAMENCFNSEAVNGDEAVGGIVGTNDGTVAECINTGEITGKRHGIYSDTNVGGIAGTNSGVLTNCDNSNAVHGYNQVSGVVGWNRAGRIEKSTNSGTVTGDEDVGGVVGYHYSGSVKLCSNTGVLDGNINVGGVVGKNNSTVESCDNTRIVTGNSNVGGVVGYHDYGTVKSCYNTGAVVGYENVGGVVGKSENAVQNCYNIGNTMSDGLGLNVGGVVGFNDNYGKVENCYNTGAVGGDEDIDVGGVIGLSYAKSVVTSNYFLKTDTINSNLNGIGIGNGGNNVKAITAADFTMQGTFQNWDFSAVWGMGTMGDKNIRPVLRTIPEMSMSSPSPKPNSSFGDVPVNSYYYDAVTWAVERGITSGTGANMFSPNNSCTRGQIVTFLWRAAGMPEPKSLANPFTDVKPTDYYYKAVLWAVEDKITAGTGNGSFSPSKPCTRGQAVTFLWRANNQPAAHGSSFGDVQSGSYYEQAVKWAVASKITSGTGKNTFSPDKPCSRAEIVTFLYRSQT